MFIDRQRELEALERRYASDQAELYVLYGRRRVGKTELLRAFCEAKRHIFFVADLGTEAGALAELTRRISQFAYDRPDAIGPFPSWDAAFDFLARLATRERLVVVLDEFTYLIDTNAAIPSILQRRWDTGLRETRLMLILCGSYVGMMERHVLSYRSPLYGRRTAQWQLQPLAFPDAIRFFPAGFGVPAVIHAGFGVPAVIHHTDRADRVRAYSIVGGVPAYLLQLDDRVSLLDNVEQRILTLGTFLYDEPRFLLLQELGDPHRYFAILEAIAAGRTRQNEIAQAAGIAPSSIPFYLATLRELGLVERVVPATEERPEKSKRGIYRLRDNYFRFWFRFAYPNRSLLERGQAAIVRDQVGDQLDQFTGPTFEAICREHVWALHGVGELGFAPRTVGSWWDDREEIDVVVVGEADVMLGECTWTARPVGTNVLDDLARKAQALLRRRQWPRIRHALFSRSGFTPALRSRAKDEGVALVDLAAICR